MREAAEHLSTLGGAPSPRAIYTDLDGTLLGPGGSLFAAAQGGISLRAAEAVAVIHDAGVDLVPVSGRTAAQVHEVARVLGARDFIAELGGITSLDLGREVIRDYGAYAGVGTPHEAMTQNGAAGLLLEAFGGRLQPHAPWAFLDRECSMLFRGKVDVGVTHQLLEDSGLGWLSLVDNGVIGREFPGLDVDEVHAYHLLPRGVTKSTGVAAHRAHRGLRTDECIAVGDSPSDLVLASEVAAVFIVANGREGVERAGPVADNVFATSGENGEGFAEVALGLLAP